MHDVELAVSFAGPLVSLQDGGRTGHMRFGVCASGPMDRLAFDAGNAALGNACGQTALEISLGGVVVECRRGAVSVAVAGGEFQVEHAGKKVRGWSVLTLREGERLAIRAGRGGSWAYLCFAGEVEGQTWLGSRATHSTSGFGGGTITSDMTLRVRTPMVREDRVGAIARPEFRQPGPVRVVLGPQDRCFDPGAVEALFTQSFAVSDAYDRMGMRLKGPLLDLDGALSIPSEPILRGAIQVAGDGVPTVLLADHQTTGGYPKIATLLGHETDRVAQYRAGDRVRFAKVSAAEAVEDARRFAGLRAGYLEKVAVARGGLQARLMRENLIHAWGDDFA